MSRVFRKTALGIATFTKKETGLSASQRALLIMIDGKRSASDLRKFGATFGDVNGLLRNLYDAGLIELDPNYIDKLQSAQAEIARESEAMGMSFGTETVVAGTRTVVPGAGVKHDLRNFGMPVASAPLATAPQKTANVANNREALSLTLTPVDAHEDELSISSSSVAPATLQDAKDFAKRFVFEALGNSGTALCMAIDRVDALKGLLETARIARGTLREMRGEATAADFNKQLREILLQ
jgi:hypothetical protein